MCAFERSEKGMEFYMKKIGIVIAMEEEFQAIENKIKEIKIHEEKGLNFF